MRSTGFVILSICVHALAVAAIALNPQRLSEGPHGAEVEILTGEESETPGAENAPADKVTEAPPAAAPAAAAAAPTPTPAPTLTPVPPQPQVVAKPVVKKAAPKKVAVAPVKKAEPSEEPEKLDPQTESNIPPVPTEQAQEEVKQEEPKQEEAAPAPAPEPVAVKEEPKPAKVEETKPVVAQTQPQQSADEKHDDMAAAAAAAAVASKNEKAQGTTAAAAGTSSNDTADLGQGGATKAGAVTFTELKQMTGNRAPVYPLSARREKRQGSVELLYRVTKEGNVTEVQIAQSSGSEDLDNAALKAVSKFRFVPGQEGWARHPVHFNLKGDTAEAPGRLRTKVGAQDQE